MRHSLFKNVKGVKVINDLSKEFGNDSKEKFFTENVLYLKEHF